jgi:recombination protein RecA
LPPFQDAEIEIHYGKGFNYYASLTDTLLQYYGAEKAGAWYKHKELGKWQGKDGLRKLLEKNTDLQAKVEKILASPATVKIGE